MEHGPDRPMLVGEVVRDWRSQHDHRSKAGKAAANRAVTEARRAVAVRRGFSPDRVASDDLKTRLNDEDQLGPEEVCVFKDAASATWQAWCSSQADFDDRRARLSTEFGAGVDLLVAAVEQEVQHLRVGAPPVDLPEVARALTAEFLQNRMGSRLRTAATDAEILASVGGLFAVTLLARSWVPGHEVHLLTRAAELCGPDAEAAWSQRELACPPLADRLKAGLRHEVQRLLGPSTHPAVPAGVLRELGGARPLAVFEDWFVGLVAIHAWPDRINNHQSAIIKLAHIICGALCTATTINVMAQEAVDAAQQGSAGTAWEQASASLGGWDVIALGARFSALMCAVREHDLRWVPEVTSSISSLQNVLSLLPLPPAQPVAPWWESPLNPPRHAVDRWADRHGLSSSGEDLLTAAVTKLERSLQHKEYAGEPFDFRGPAELTAWLVRTAKRQPADRNLTEAHFENQPSHEAQPAARRGISTIAPDFVAAQVDRYLAWVGQPDLGRRRWPIHMVTSEGWRDQHPDFVENLEDLAQAITEQALTRSGVDDQA